VTTRRELLAALPFASLRAGAAAPHAHHLMAVRAAQQTSGGGQGTADAGPMDTGAYRSTRRPPKPGARPSMSSDERDALERTIHCQCGCTLDIFTCRTTDFACQVSPAMHRDVMSLVEGGYGAAEIVEAFEGTYGERVLMAPTKSGFNLVGWGMPFAVLAAGGTVLTLLLRSWRRRAQVRAAAAPPVGAPGYRAPAVDDATPEELARLEAAVRGEGP
jgi:cytochrome c-type biogenesis protein CcmH